MTSTKAIKTWTSSKERKHFIQALKKEAVALLHKDKKAKGAIKTNTFTKIKRIQYIKTRFIELMDKKLFKIPSMEKMLKFVCSITIIELILVNKFEKVMDSPNKS